MPKEHLPVGKLPMELLHTLLARHTWPDARLVVGPQIGEDAAVIDMGDRYLVAKSDPITFATDEIGWYVVQINANDVATMGATPRWFLLTLLLPEGHTDRKMVEAIFDQVGQACQSLDIVLSGGHTEITHGLERPIAVGIMLGEVEKDALVRTAGAQVGDDVILTKGIAIEGTAILALEAAHLLRDRVDGDVLARARRFLRDPGISVLRDAQIVTRAGRVHAMHDPTEGGLATGLWEVARASGRGIIVDLEAVPIFSETETFTRLLGLEPLGLIASGALVVVAPPQDSPALLRALAGGGIPASVIGQVVAGPAGVQARTPAGLEPLPIYEQDEIGRVFV